MVESEPLPFTIAEQDANVSLARVAMHRAFEADKSGRTSIHVWIKAEAAPATEDFATIDAKVEFILYNDDRRLGSCTARDLKFTDKEDTVDVVADDDLRIESHENVSRIEVEVDSTRLTRSKATLKLEPE